VGPSDEYRQSLEALDTRHIDTAAAVRANNNTLRQVRADLAYLELSALTRQDLAQLDSLEARVQVLLDRSEIRSEQHAGPAPTPPLQLPPTIFVITDTLVVREERLLDHRPAKGHKPWRDF
jgi:hypothetical protein